MPRLLCQGNRQQGLTRVFGRGRAEGTCPAWCWCRHSIRGVGERVTGCLCNTLGTCLLCLEYLIVSAPIHMFVCTSWCSRGAVFVLGCVRASAPGCIVWTVTVHITDPCPNHLRMHGPLPSFCICLHAFSFCLYLMLWLPCKSFKFLKLWKWQSRKESWNSWGCLGDGTSWPQRLLCYHVALNCSSV